MNKAIIVDIDGTLANCDHRLQYLKETPKNWDKFYSLLSNDEPNIWCAHIIFRENYFNEIQIILITGRPAKYKAQTIHWLNWHKIEYDLLFMRKDDDHRQDYEIKKEIYENKIKGKYDILFVLEDRKQVVDMWRSLGLVCLQCADGNY